MPKQDPSFPDRLQRLLDEKKMTRADLARNIWGTIFDERGYEVAKNRQSISKYLSGTAHPSISTLKKMSVALNVGISDLCPMSDPTNRPGSGITLTQVDDKRSRLDLHLVLPTGVAGEVIATVAKYST